VIANVPLSGCVVIVVLADVSATVQLTLVWAPDNSRISDCYYYLEDS
jgi:hypothetical protein